MQRALWACALLVGAQARAQFGASVGIESDYRFRGVSLSDGRPDGRLSVSYDHDSGAFAGATATQVEFTRGRHSTQLLGYAGLVVRATPELSGEFGVARSTFTRDARYDYSEVFAGAVSERWSLRAYYAPDYFGFGRATTYLELDANAPLATKWRVFGHVGALTAHGSGAIEDQRRTRVDVRFGVGLSVTESVDVQLAWVGASRGGPYVVEYNTRREALVLGVLASF